MEQAASNGFESNSVETRLSSRGDIIRWWESRRHTYNGVLLAVGFASLILVLTAGSAAVKPGEDFEEPFAIIIGTGIYVATANVCYTLGWIVDTIWYNGNPRKRLYKSGLTVAAFFSAFPGVWAVVAWLITIYTGRKLN